MLRVLFLALFLIPNLIPGQASDSIRSKKVKVLPVPTIGYSPETRLYFGAVSLLTLDFYQDQKTRTSNAKLEINYTLNNQLILESGWNYFFKDEKWFTRGLLHYSKYPDLYFGIGDDTPPFNETQFESNRIIVDVDFLAQLWPKMFAGLGLNYSNYYNIDKDSISFTELTDESTFGFNLIILQDSRNNILNPSQGSYIELLAANNFSSELYTNVSLDLRKYFMLGKNNRHILAGRFYTSMVMGTPPFFDYSLLGGDRFTRGYFYGRFRDKNFNTVQAEYRSSLFWRLGIAAFGGISLIHDEYSNITSTSVKPNIGLGLRFLVDKQENTNLRIDYAIGNDGQDGFYITFGESF